MSDGPERDEHGRLLPGHTANPNGRPKKGTSLTELLSAKLDQMSISDGKGGTVSGKEMVVNALIKAALTLPSDKRTEISKDVAMRAVTAIFDRLDGKPAETVQYENKGGDPLRVIFHGMTKEELDRLPNVKVENGNQAVEPSGGDDSGAVRAS